MELMNKNAHTKWVELAEQAYKVTELRKECERREAELYQQLTKLSRNKACKGGGYIYKSIERKGSIEYKAIPELKMIDLEKYRKPSTIFWKLEYTGL